MASELFCPFYSAQTSEDCWDFVGSRGNGLKNKGGYWNFATGRTGTNNTGPTQGHTHGYVYCESGSPTRAGSEFTMTSVATFDASASEISVKYWYNCNTDTPVLLEVFGWDGFKWVLEDKVLPEQYELEDVWYQRTFFIENYTNTDCRVRFKVTILDGGKSYLKDFALDSVTISTSNTDADLINAFFVANDINKVKKFDKRFKASHKPKPEFDTILEEFRANIQDFDFSKYPDGIVIEETPQIVHVYTSKDKE